MPRARKPALWEAEIPLPYPDDPARSLAEQRRIVARIEALFAELRECRRLQAEIVADTGRMMDAIIAERFDQGIHSGWSWRAINDFLISPPQYGTSKKATSEPIGVPVLRMGNIRHGRLVLGDLKYVKLSEAELSSYSLRRGDILFNRTNSAELVGKSAVYDRDEEMVFASYLIRLRLDTTSVNPWFINYYINSPLGKKYVQSQLTRAIGQVNVNAQKIRAMPIPIPASSDDQDQLVSFFESLNVETAAMNQLSQEDGDLLAEMEQAILAQAICGEL